MDVIACPGCGLGAPEDFTFCPRCGAKLAARPAVSEERKVVTTLFCDLVAFTSMSEAADPEDVDALLCAYNAAARKAIESRGGTVEKFIGDAVVGVFGVPRVHEDDAERAVRAGLHLVEAIEGMSRPDGSPLQCRIGINTGEAVVRLDVDPSSGRGFLTGDAVNTAARLEAVAQPMGIVVGELTHALTRDLFAYEELPPLVLKGKSGSVKAWRPRGHVAVASHGTGGHTAARLTGREHELAVFSAALFRLAEGEGGLALVTGEAGIGKTRLVAEARGKAAELGCAWLEGRTLSFGRSISYWPFQEIIEQNAGVESDDDEAERVAKLSARVSALFGEETPEVLPYLATLLNYPVPEEYAERVRYADGEAMGRQVYRASRLFFARLARVQPLVLVFEDMHWLDNSSAALLEHLVPLTKELPLLLCCVSRPEMDSPLMRVLELARGDYAERSTEVALQPLSAEETAILARRLAGVQDLPAKLRRTILAKAGGNPFFVEEIVRSLIDLGGLAAAGDGRFRVTEMAAELAVPDTLVGVIMARIDRLDDDLKSVLCLASVVGRTFFYRVLAAISEADRQLDESLAGLQQRELILERARDPELEYIFKHALVQEATYGSILLARRRQLHRRVGETIETLFSGRIEDFYGLLAYHYTKAEDWAKAQEYLFKAADQAGAIAADAEALDHYERAIEVYAKAFGDRWDLLERATLERKMGDALFRCGEHARGREYLFRSLARMGYPWPKTSLSLWWAILVQVLRQLAHRLLPIHHKPRPAQNARVAEERFRIYHTLTIMDAGAEQSQLLLGLLVALNLAESTGLGWQTMGALAGMGYACDLVPLRLMSRFYHRRALRLATQVNDPFAVATLHWLMGFHEYWATGDWTGALEYDLAAGERFHTLGRFREWGTSMIEAVNVMVDQGRLSEARPLCEEVVGRAEEAGDPVVFGWGKCRMGNILMIQGEHENAEKALRTGIDSLLRTMQPADAVSGFGWLALCLLRQGRTADARAVVAEQAERIRRYGVMGYFLRGLGVAKTTLGLLEAESQHGTARAAALKEAKAACRQLRRTARADIFSTVAAYRLRGTYEWWCARPKNAEGWWRKSLAMAEKLGTRYEGALTELEAGRLTGDRDAVRRAAGTFEATGAAFDLAMARQILNVAERGLAAAG